ncbi:MAG: hypothetical protein LBK60_08410 [Verrucomicrobiales bacterium]|jgi:hypothetical protein|nr:hypothetical protein [Verrucomicrobiales bacterium]
MIVTQDRDEVMLHWLTAGAFVVEVSPLYQDNYHVPAEPYARYFAEVEAVAARVSARMPDEGERVALHGLEQNWRRHRAAAGERKLTWSSGGTFARLQTALAVCRVVTREPRAAQWPLELTGGGAVWVNGAKVFEQRALGRTEGRFEVAAELRAGANVVLVAVTNVHVLCVNSFALTWSGPEAEVELPLLPVPGRARVEEWLAGLWLADNLPAADDAVVLRGSGAAPAGTRLRVEIVRADGALNVPPVWRGEVAWPAGARQVTLCAAGELAGCHAGARYAVRVAWLLGKHPVTAGGALPFTVRAWLPALPRAEAAGRRAWLMKQYAAQFGALGERLPRQRMFLELARAGGGAGGTDWSSFAKELDYINRRYDCADFALHGLLRWYYRHRDDAAVPRELLAAAADCILGFKYSEDEPGNSMMFTRSENHAMLFFSAEYLAGLLFPDVVFTNNGQTGRWHMERGGRLAAEWLRDKGRHGFTEWHSNTYYEEDLLALLDLVDFGAADEMRRMARDLLEVMVFILATHSFQGVFGTTHGRCYEQAVMHPECEPVSHLNWLLFGTPGRLMARLSIGAVALADSAYVPAAAVARLAVDKAPLLTRSRMGYFEHLRGGGVNCATYRTRDYMVSGMVAAHVGGFGAQTHAGQVTLDGGVPVFVSCFDNKSAHTRPSYWGGQFRNPRSYVSGSLLAYIYRIDAAAGYTHCYFPRAAFDEVARRGRWLFGRKHEAYVAVFSLKDYTETERGEWQGRELLCLEKRNVWLLEAGCRAEYGGFAQFMKAVSGARWAADGEDLEYASPRNGRLFLSYERTCTRDGAPLLAENYPMLDNAFARAEYGSGVVTFNHGGRETRSCFN